MLPFFVSLYPKGTRSEALSFVMRSNKRRDLTSSQWAAIAVESESIYEAIRVATEEDRRAKQSDTKTGMKYNKASERNLSENLFSDKKTFKTLPKS